MFRWGLTRARCFHWRLCGGNDSPLMVVGGFSQSCIKLQKSWLLPICYTVKTQLERRTAGGREMIASGAVSARWPAPPLLTTGVMFRNVLAAGGRCCGPQAATSSHCTSRKNGREDRGEKREERSGGIASIIRRGKLQWWDPPFEVLVCLCIIVLRIGFKLIVWILSSSL